MCGIAGILSNGVRSESELVSSIQKMNQSLVHRGPDSSGYFVSDKIVLGHRRLSILDLSPTGSQPMTHTQSRNTIVFNGEIYNYSSLRSELLTIGHQFKGTSDSEVVLHTYAEWGFEGIRRLEGMFALAIWDASLDRLILVRDRLGIKPLFYADCSLGLSFGSEIKAILSLGTYKSVDSQALREYLWYGNTFGSRTFYKGIRSLEPGYCLICQGEQRTLEPWWRIEEWAESDCKFNSFEDAASHLRSAIDTSVSRQLVSDVPVGIFLSGGLDSSAIAAAASKSQVPILSYAAGFDYEKGVDELPKAAQVAEYLGLDHHEVRITGSDLSDVLLHLANSHDEPFADAANIPLYLLCRKLSGQIKVVLQGDGGDEIFGGYRRYSLLRNSTLWKLVPDLIKKISRYMGSSGRRFERIASSVGNHDDAMRMAFLLTTEVPYNPPESTFLEDKRDMLLETTDPFLAYRQASERFSNFDLVQQMLLTDLTVQLPSQFLPKVDRATMAAGIEARVPLLDERIAQMTVNLPSEWKVNRTTRKSILKKAMRGQLPDTIIDAPKTGFGVPYSYWLSTSLYDFAIERLLDHSFLAYFDLDPVVIESMINNHVSGKFDHGFPLWKLLHLQLWSNNRGLA